MCLCLLLFHTMLGMERGERVAASTVRHGLHRSTHSSAGGSLDWHAGPQSPSRRRVRFFCHFSNLYVSLIRCVQLQCTKREQWVLQTLTCHAHARIARAPRTRMLTDYHPPRTSTIGTTGSRRYWPVTMTARMWSRGVRFFVTFSNPYIW